MYVIRTFIDLSTMKGQICGKNFSLHTESFDEIYSKAEFLLKKLQEKQLIELSLLTKIEKIKNYLYLISDNVEERYQNDLKKQEEILHSIQKEIGCMKYVLFSLDNYLFELSNETIMSKPQKEDWTISLLDIESVDDLINNGYKFNDKKTLDLYIKRKI